MRVELVALTVAVAATASAIPAAVGNTAQATRAWRAVRHEANGRREVARAALHSAWVRIAKVTVQTAMLAILTRILWLATVPVSWRVTAFVWLVAASQALSAHDAWGQRRSRVRLIRDARDGR